jgi:hypothetical protein
MGSPREGVAPEFFRDRESFCSVADFSRLKTRSRWVGARLEKSMTRNLAVWDRWLRIVMALPLVVCSVWAPLSLWMRLTAFAVPAVYIVWSALRGHCVGYALVGRSTCAAKRVE